jgi:hypothetical protein
VGCAFYIGTTMSKNTNQSQSTSTSESTSTQTGTAIDVNSTIVTDLMKNGAVLLNRRGLSNYFGFLYKSKGILADNLDNNYKIMSGIIMIEADSENNGKDVSADKFNDYMIQIFGSYVIYSNTNPIFCASHKYDSTKDAYVYFKGGCGGASAISYLSKVTDARQYDDRIEITEKVIKTEYIIKDGQTTGTRNVAKPYSSDIIAEGLDSEITVNIEDYIDKADTYLYTFKKDTDGHYYFYSIALQ